MTERGWHWTIGLIQLAIACGAAAWFAETGTTRNGLIIGGFGFGVAYLLTIPPIKLFYWSVSRRIARDEGTRKRF